MPEDSIATARFSGIIPPVTTPFFDNGDLDLDGLSRNIAVYNEIGLSGYVVLGSNGEAVHLSASEKRIVIEAVRRSAAPGMCVIAGVNEMSARAAVEASAAAADSGADAVLVTPPYFYKSSMTRQAILRHFTEVADASAVPVIIYNVPQNTGIIIEPDLIAELSRHANVTGVKDSSGDLGAISDTLRGVPGDFQVLVGNGSIAYAALLMGAVGGILAVACVAGRACVELFQCVRGGNHQRARELQNRIAPISQFVTTGVGISRLKAALDLAGMVGGAPRSPLSRLDAGGSRHLEMLMRESGFFAGRLDERSDRSLTA